MRNVRSREFRRWQGIGFIYEMIHPLKMTTENRPIGRRCYVRLVANVSSANEVLHETKLHCMARHYNRNLMNVTAQLKLFATGRVSIQKKNHDMDMRDTAWPLWNSRLGEVHAQGSAQVVLAAGWCCKGGVDPDSGCPKQMRDGM